MFEEEFEELSSPEKALYKTYNPLIITAAPTISPVDIEDELLEDELLEDELEYILLDEVP